MFSLTSLCVSYLLVFFGYWVQPVLLMFNISCCFVLPDQVFTWCLQSWPDVCICVFKLKILTLCICMFGLTAPGGKLRSVLQFNAGLQKRLPKYSSGNHGECTDTHTHTHGWHFCHTERYTVTVAMATFPSSPETLGRPFVLNKLSH